MSEVPPVQLALIADGPTDEALLEPLAWAFRQLDPHVPLLAPLFRPRRPPGRSLHDMVDELFREQAPDLLFIHRDAEKMTLEARKREIPIGAKVVPVVPVRMTEAWLLIDELAIRTAAGNPNGSVVLALPKLQRIESISDPKGLLYELLVQASEFRGRRRQQFQSSAAARRVAHYVQDFTPLRQLEAFREMERDLAAAWRK